VHKRNRRGQVTVLFALSAIPLFGFAAIAFDLGATMQDRRNLQAFADDAAIAGAWEYKTGPNVSANKVHWIAMQYLQQPLNFTLPQSSCTSLSACPAGTYTLGAYTVTLADPGSNRLDLSISHAEPAIFAKILGAGTVNAGSSARATQPYVAPCGLCIMHDTAPNALDIQGNGAVSVTGAGFMDNSSDPTLAAHLEANGGLTVSAPYSIGIAPGGGWTQSGTGGFSPAPVPKPPVADPLANVALPTTPGPPCLVGPTSGTANPGCYTTLGGGGAVVNLNPGTYVITSQILLGDFGVSGTGVTLYFACALWPTPCLSVGEVGATVIGSSNGSLNISAPAANSGQPYPGMAIFFDRNNTSQLTLQSNGSATITGTIYAPSAQLHTSGNGGYTINGTVIIKTALLSGNGALNFSYDPNQNYSPPGGSGLIR
jgi:Flp pilus assembly protein TadG